MLAETIGESRSQVNFFTNEFRELRFIRYKNSEIHVNNSRLSIVLHDCIDLLTMPKDAVFQGANSCVA
jgi:hypothetical protein